MVSIRKFLQGIGLIPVTSTAVDTKGEMEVLDASGKLNYHNGTSASPMVTEAHSATLTNKTIDADSNTISNIENADIKVGAAIDAAKIADGSVSSTEFQYLSGVTSDIQTQLNNGSTALTDHINDATDAHDASAISSIPSGNLAATDVQGALNELQTDIDGRQLGPLTGDVTTSGAAATIANDAVSNAKLANMATQTIKGRTTAGTGDPEDLTATQATAILDNFVGDSGSGGTKGLVLAPTAGDAAANKYLKADGTWATVVGTSLTTKGDLQTFSTVNARLPIGTNGQKLVADSAETVGIKWQSDNRTINAQTGTTYTFVLADGVSAGNNPLVTASNAAAQTYTVPPNSSVAFPVGTQIDLTQLGAGLVTLAPGSGVTLNSASGGLVMAGQYSAATLIKTATDVWEVYGTGVTSTSTLTLSDWISYTPTFTGFGTAASIGFSYRRVGDSMDIMGRFTTGTTTGSTAQITLPTGFSIDTTKVPSTRVFGEAYKDGGVGDNISAFYGSSATAFEFGLTVSNAVSAVAGNAGFSDGVVYYLSIKGVPISGWTSNSSGTVAAPRSQISALQSPGNGSTNTTVLRWSTVTTTGSDITATQSSTNGDLFTVNSAGVYAVTACCPWNGASNTVGITINGSALTTNVTSITYAQGLRSISSIAHGGPFQACWTGILAANDIIRIQNDTNKGSLADDRIQLTIVKVSN